MHLMPDQNLPPADGQLVTPPTANRPTGDEPGASLSPKGGKWWVWLVAIVLLVSIFAGASWWYLGTVNRVSDQTPASSNGETATAETEKQPAKKNSTEPTTASETLNDAVNSVTTELTELDLALEELDADQIAAIEDDTADL